MSTVSQSTQSTHSLRAGQAMHLPLACGDAVVVTRGSVRLRTPPQWLAGQVLAGACRLDEGEHQLIETSGWVVVEADAAEAGVCVVSRQGAVVAPRASALAWLRRLAF